MRWDGPPLVIGERATAISTVESVEKKGFEKGKPMVFVNQNIEVTMVGKKDPSIVEKRSHVYLPESASVSNSPREVKDLPTSVDFSLQYTPSSTTLFRFSALTFNGHYIHLDKDYAQKEEGYPGGLMSSKCSVLPLCEQLTVSTCKQSDWCTDL